MPAAELVACCDLQPALATSTARHFGAERSYTDLAEMLAREQLDAAMVVGLPAMHEECARACLEAGLHTMTEKPIARSLTEALALAGLARSKGLITQVGHNMRYAPLVQKVRQIMAGPEFGDLLYLESRYHMEGPGWVTPSPAGWGFDTDPEGWFYLIAQGVHAIDLAREVGGEIASVHTTVGRTGRAERFAMVVSVVFASGACGAITMTGASANWSTRLEVVGDGAATLRLTDLNHLVYEPNGPDASYPHEYGVPSEVWSTPTRDDSSKRAGYLGEMEAFVVAVRDGTPTRPSFDDACQAMRVVVAIIESAQTGAIVAVPHDPSL